MIHSWYMMNIKFSWFYFIFRKQMEKKCFQGVTICINTTFGVWHSSFPIFSKIHSNRNISLASHQWSGKFQYSNTKVFIPCSPYQKKIHNTLTQNAFGSIIGNYFLSHTNSIKFILFRKDVMMREISSSESSRREAKNYTKEKYSKAFCLFKSAKKRERKLFKV